MEISVIQAPNGCSHSVDCVMSPRDAVDLEGSLSVGMQVSAL